MPTPHQAHTCYAPLNRPRHQWLKAGRALQAALEHKLKLARIERAKQQAAAQVGRCLN
jgi:hypothetical protein